MLNGKIPGSRSCLILLLPLFSLLFQPLLFAEPPAPLAAPYQSFNPIEVSCLTTMLPPELTDQELPSLFSHYPVHSEDPKSGYTLHECRFHFLPGFRSAVATILSIGLSSGESLSATRQMIRQVALMFMALVLYQAAVTQPSDMTSQHPSNHAYCYSSGSDSNCPTGHCTLISLCQRHPCHQDGGDDNNPDSDHTYNPTEYCPKCGTTPCREAYPRSWVALLDFDYEWLFKDEEIVDVVSIDTLPTSDDLTVSTRLELESLLCTEEEFIGIESMDIFPDWEPFRNFESNLVESACSSGETSNSEESSDSKETSSSEEPSDSEEISENEEVRIDDNYSPEPNNRITRGTSRNRSRLLLLPFLWHLVNSGEHPDIVNWSDKKTGLFHVRNTFEFSRLWNIHKGNKKNKVCYDNLSRSMRLLQKRKGLVPLETPKRCHFRFDLKHRDVLNLKSQSRQTSNQD
ncbi:ETS domain-containing protein [Endozoicomonas lisbonensis]|uniref:ETS domain-containing protein n=1 Tax=Endozoicomonas lisbonensis TaxID=3120522 RepID=A0ABV2SEW7_9GAMM